MWLRITYAVYNDLPYSGAEPTLMIGGQKKIHKYNITIILKVKNICIIFTMKVYF
jgi:hypothetical protein